MSPELRFVIYSSIVAVISGAVAAGIKLLIIDKIAARKTAPIDRGQAITDLADAVVDVSKKAVDGVRAELELVRQELAEVKRREAAADARHRMRIAQLVRVIEGAGLTVPPETVVETS